MSLDELISLYEANYAQLLNDMAHSEEIRICEQTVYALEELRRARKRLTFLRDSLHHLAVSDGHLSGWVCAVLDNMEGIA